MKYIELTNDEYNAIIASREQLNELFGFSKKSGLDTAKDKAVSDIRNTTNDIDDEKKKREELRKKLVAMKGKT